MSALRPMMSAFSQGVNKAIKPVGTAYRTYSNVTAPLGPHLVNQLPQKYQPIGRGALYGTGALLPAGPAVSAYNDASDTAVGHSGRQLAQQAGVTDPQQLDAIDSRARSRMLPMAWKAVAPAFAGGDTTRSGQTDFERHGPDGSGGAAADAFAGGRPVGSPGGAGRHAGDVSKPAHGVGHQVFRRSGRQRSRCGRIQPATKQQLASGLVQTLSREQSLSTSAGPRHTVRVQPGIRAFTQRAVRNRRQPSPAQPRFLLPAHAWTRSLTTWLFRAAYWLGAWICADVLAGMVHWWEDRYGNPDWPARAGT
jgi:hypothetical protein